MNMHDFYRRLFVQPERPHERRLISLTRASRAQVLNVTSELTWYIWDAQTRNA